MKKNTIALSAIVMLAITSFYSCKKKTYNNTDQLANLSKATISGKVYARIVDTAGAAATQYAPTITEISAWIDTRELIYYSDATAPYARRYYKVNVDANGKYSLTVDVSKYRTAIVHLEPAKFVYNQVKKTAPDSVYTVSKTFSSIDVPLMIGNDSTITQDLYYTY